MNENGLSTGERRLLALILVSIVVLVGADLATDSKEGVQWPHLLVELSVALAAAVGFAMVMRDSFKKTHQLDESRELAKARELEVERWKADSRKFIEGLSAAIDTQLERWALTHSEKEVALLLLKGLSLKEIAEIRKTTEKTARAQSVAVYSKSGLAGRSELSAFFLEDLLMPIERPAQEHQD